MPIYITDTGYGVPIQQHLIGVRFHRKYRYFYSSGVSVLSIVHVQKHRYGFQYTLSFS